MKPKTLSISFLALVVALFVWKLVRGPVDVKSEQVKGSPPFSGLSKADSQSESRDDTAPKMRIATSKAASVENSEQPRNTPSTRDLQAGRAVSLEIVSTIYDPLLEKLNVSDEVRKQILELACNERQAAYDVVSSANKSKLDYLSNPEVQRMALDAAKSEDEKIRELLSAEDFDKFVDYRNTRTIQVSVAKVIENLSENGGPQLTDSQVNALIKVFRDAQTPGQLVRAPINAVLNLNGAGVTEPILNAARLILSDQQFAALKQVQAGQSVPNRAKIGAPPVSEAPH